MGQDETQRVLVVDDEADIIDLAALYLEGEGFEVLRAQNGAAALDVVREEPPSLVILDIMLPGIDGWEVCRRIRATSSLPIIMLTAKGDPIDRVVGLELGADDYIVKPFHGRELVARVRAVLRRSGADNSEEERPPAPVTLGDMRIDADRREVWVGQEAVEMRAREFDLLLYLARNEGRVHSRDQLLEHVWGYDFLGDSRTVDVHIAHVRSRISASQQVHIDTVWGVGYKLVANR